MVFCVESCRRSLLTGVPVVTVNRRVGAVLKVALTVIIIYFVYRQVATNWAAIRAHEWAFHWGYLLLSIAAGIITFVLLSALWGVIIAGFGHRLRVSESYRVFYLSNLGRYIPGKVWQLFGILYLAGRKGIPPARATISFVAVQLFAIPASFLVFAVMAGFRPALLEKITAALGMDVIYVFVAVMIALSLAIMLFPEPIFSLTDRILRRFKWGELPFRMKRRTAIGLYLGYVVAWTCYGFAFWCFLRGVSGSGEVGVVAAIGCFNGAYQIGYLALFAPGGIGPRELILGLLLGPFLGPLAPAVAVLARIWSIVLEGLAALIALGVGKGPADSTPLPSAPITDKGPAR